MAQTLTNIMPKILARALKVLREQVKFVQLVNTSFSAEAKKKGQTIDIPKSTAVTAINVTPDVTKPAVEDHTPELVQISLDNWKQNKPVHVDDDELGLIDKRAHFLPMQLEEAVRSLARAVNQSMWTEYYNVYAAVGTAGTTPFATTTADVISARKKLHSMLAPRPDRRMLVDYDAEEKILLQAAFTDVEKVGGERLTKFEGEIGRKLGFDWWTDDDVPSHVAGTPGGTPLTNGIQAAGSSSVVIDGMTGTTGDYHKGDIITFAGDTQQYAVTALATADATGEATVSIAPNLVNAVADGVVPTLVASHVANMAFHKDAFALAIRPLATSKSDLEVNPNIMTMVDPVSGIPLRLEVTRVHKMTLWEFDILWGVRCVQPAYACRVLG